MAFFKKVACFTDIHFGMKGNSRVHNDDCEAFIYWFIEQAKAHGCESCIFFIQLLGIAAQLTFRAIRLKCRVPINIWLIKTASTASAPT